MKFSSSSLLALLAVAATTTQTSAFTTMAPTNTASKFGLRTPATFAVAARTNMMRLQAATSDTNNTNSSGTPEEEEENLDPEVQRLQAMAAKLRAEAAALEEEQAALRREATEKAFQEFDANNDGEISLEELKAALEKAFQMEISDDRVETLMRDFDTSGDGKLQRDEFVTIEQFRNRLEFLQQEERRMKLESAKIEAKEKEVAQLIESQLELINDKEPTNTDKILSVLPYLFPLVDGVSSFGQHIVLNNAEGGNPAAVILALVYALYRSVPFSGFITFFALSFLSGNPSLNRLVRFNMQQAIYLDIALFFPSLLGGLIGIISSGTNVQLLPPALAQLGNDAIFLGLLATLAYTSISSLLGVAPDKIPLLSKAASDRMPSIDQSMFDSEGKFDPESLRRDDKKDDQKKD